MRLNVLVQFLTTYLLTIALYAVLSLLTSSAIEPVRFVAARSSDDVIIRYHGKPALDAFGATAWLGVLILYAVLTLLPFAHRGRLQISRLPLVFSLTIATVAFVHPLLVPLLLPSSWRGPYVHFFETLRLPVGAGRIGLNVLALLTVVSFLQALSICIFLTRGRDVAQR